jgi:hypothetical protein
MPTCGRGGERSFEIVAYERTVLPGRRVPRRLRAPIAAAFDRDRGEISRRHRTGCFRLDHDVRHVERDFRELLTVPHQPGRDHLSESTDESLQVDVRLPEDGWTLDPQKRMRVQDPFQLRGEHSTGYSREAAYSVSSSRRPLSATGPIGSNRTPSPLHRARTSSLTSTSPGRA